MSADLLRRCAARLRRLRLEPHDPAEFLAERDELARLIETEAAGRRRDAAPPPTFYRVADPPPDPRLRRLEALARDLAAQNENLRRLMRQASRPRPRRSRQAADAQQLALKLNIQ
jgi:hypothetical protein